MNPLWLWQMEKAGPGWDLGRKEDSHNLSDNSDQKAPEATEKGAPVCYREAS